MEVTYRKWQKYVIDKVMSSTERGCFIGALGGRGKTVCALEIARQKRFKKVLVVNNSLEILKGWIKTWEELDYKSKFELTAITQRKLKSLIEKGGLEQPDILIIDEWQNGSSDSYTKLYKKVKRQYTIALSATPSRQMGLNHYNLEKTLWGYANPNQKFNWQLAHGKLVYDRFSYSKQKWESFRDYDQYIGQLPLYFSSDEIEKVEGATENNGYKINEYTIKYRPAEPELLRMMDGLNIVATRDGSFMPKASFGRSFARRMLEKSRIKITDGLLESADVTSDFFDKIKKIISNAKNDTLIVAKQKEIANQIASLGDVGIWTGDEKFGLDKKVVVATEQKIGVGVDGLQFKYKNIVICDPVDKESGAYDDFRQLLWRVTGSRQQHDVNLVYMEVDNG